MAEKQLHIYIFVEVQGTEKIDILPNWRNDSDSCCFSIGAHLLSR